VKTIVNPAVYCMEWRMNGLQVGSQLYHNATFVCREPSIYKAHWFTLIFSRLSVFTRQY